MSSTGFSTYDSASGSGWSNLTNVQVADDTYADSGSINPFNAFGEVTIAYDIASGGIPGGSTIDGIAFVVERKASDASHFYDSDVHIVVNGNPGNDKSDAGAWATSDETITYGGAADLHGLTPTLAQLEAGFSVKFNAENNGIMPATAYYDSVNITIFWTAPAGGSGAANYYYKHQGDED
jgi:hypothetical protein